MLNIPHKNNIPVFKLGIKLALSWVTSKKVFMLSRTIPNEYMEPSTMKLTNYYSRQNITQFIA